MAYIAVVYASSPFTGRIAEQLEKDALGRVLLWLVPLAAAAALVPLAGTLGYGRERKRWVVPVLVTVALYTIVWFEVCQRAIEGIHLPQYGLMGLLALRALRSILRPWAAYAMSVLVTTTVSWGGELIQSTLPDRVYDLRDVLLDGISAVLGLIVAWQLERQ